MATKKYTPAQLRKAREIIDQEEATEHERERRTKQREARRDKENRVAYKAPELPAAFYDRRLAIVLAFFALVALGAPDYEANPPATLKVICTDGICTSFFEGGYFDSPRYLIALPLLAAAITVEVLSQRAKPRSRR